MKKSIRILAFLSLVLILSFTSCVSGKKFAASEARADKFQKENVATQNKLNVCNAQV